MKEATTLSDDFYSFIDRVYQKLGINLHLYKETQMKRRLTSLRNNRGYSNFTSYFRALENDDDLLKEFIDRITINVTEFYRNPKRWSLLQNKIIPFVIKNKTQLNIWSAACSTGEEPYSIALMLKEHFPQININILATDLDETAIDVAKQGIYNERSLKDLPRHLKAKYFRKRDQLFHLDPKIKKQVTFKKHDLLTDPYPKNKDIIICRNVLIYFTDEAKDMIYEKFSKSLVEKGVLFVGSTEQIFNPGQYQLSVLDTFFYQKRKEG